MLPAGLSLPATIGFSPLASYSFLLEEASVSTRAPVNIMAPGEKLCSFLEQRVESNSEENINLFRLDTFWQCLESSRLPFPVSTLYCVWENISPIYCPVQRLTPFASLTLPSKILWKTRLPCLWWNTLVSKKICSYYCSFKEA